ncbi:hypothetical protein [Streptomyces naphthomycinicus]|uniref:hypothetical protein n=1 Tax=Streptomyces naphthomycinicus TaxID=2872625 RepID=UPI001CED9318|nr:hypothetical protein [Streptomyces sp. TML10]
MKIGFWLARQLTTWHNLHPGQQQLMTALGLTPETNPLAPARRARRTFAQTVQLLELFVHREGRAPASRETIRVDGDTVKLGAWLAKARHRHRSGQLPGRTPGRRALRRRLDNRRRCPGRPDVDTGALGRAVVLVPEGPDRAARKRRLPPHGE